MYLQCSVTAAGQLDSEEEDAAPHKAGRGRNRNANKHSNTGARPKESKEGGTSKTVNEPIKDPRYPDDWWPEHQIPPHLKSREKRCFYCGGLGCPWPRCPHLQEDLAKTPPVD